MSLTRELKIRVVGIVLNIFRNVDCTTPSTVCRYLHFCFLPQLLQCGCFGVSAHPLLPPQINKNKNKKSTESGVAPAGIKSQKFLFELKKIYFCSIQEIDGLVCKRNGQSRKFAMSLPGIWYCRGRMGN